MSATENDSPAGVVQTASPCCLGPKVRRGLLRRHGTSISTDRFCCDAIVAQGSVREETWELATSPSIYLKTYARYFFWLIGTYD